MTFGWVVDVIYNRLVYKRLKGFVTQLQQIIGLNNIWHSRKQ
ncbi:MAG: hypothetical protein NZ901_02735 [Geminocystis sp.]|nr:hypothetical protein [Geminocystis sp.]MCS7147088.1 hypothetical protein [Geminocystis sp.]MDW8116724.1 hypothetical protein [Geminocystis sp.]MDW8463452.1 hypothetical protein [Geminocystis sp.]